MEGEPVSADGADILLTDVGDGYLVEFLTAKGEALASTLPGAQAADAGSAQKKEALRAEAKAKVRADIPGRAVKPILEANFDHPFWATLHTRCLACGTCTYVCPTCHCFDIVDEVKGDKGVRCRNWDSCMFPMFTKETSGHNPRPSQKERWRQRTMHKFRYIPENFGVLGCVGCGRCVMQCPVNLDIRKIVEDVSHL
jgi:ferredoxin